MFCTNCGTEINENENFCFNCGLDLSIHQQKLSDEKPIVGVNPVEYEEIQSDPEIKESDDSDAKIQNLTSVISRLQAENIELKKQLEDYNRQESPVSKSKAEFSRKRMPKPDKEEKDGAFSKFKKWYNE